MSQKIFPQQFPTRFFLQQFPSKFSHKIFPQDFPQHFPARFSHKIFLQDFPQDFSSKIFPQDFPQHFPTRFPTRFSCRILPQQFSNNNFPHNFPARISCKNFPQDFPVIFYHNNFPQDFPKLDPDWLAPHHPIPNAKFPPITAFLKLAFPPPPCPHKNFLQELPTRFSCKIFPQEFPTRISHKIFPSWILIGWLPITLFQMLNFHQSLPFLNWLFPCSLSHKNFPQELPTRISCKIFPQDFPKLDPDWLAPHHPIPNAKFPPITAFLKLAFSPSSLSHKNLPQEFPTRFSRKIFPQEFSRKIFPQDFPELDPDWLFPHHPIPNAKFPPITALLNRPTYHKRSKVSPPPLPQILWESQINE